MVLPVRRVNGRTALRRRAIPAARALDPGSSHDGATGSLAWRIHSERAAEPEGE